MCEFTSDSWQLLEALNERLDCMSDDNCSIAYEIACKSASQKDEKSMIVLGQNEAFKKAVSDKITFIWGPPGTGKTYTLARIAIETIQKGKRILMLSYSNVSVDGAVLRVADMYDDYRDNVIRYGYPRNQKVLDDPELSSYKKVLLRNPELYKKYIELTKVKSTTKKKDAERAKINSELAKLRKKLSDEEKELVNSALFVATTVSKAVIDPAIYSQTFDTVIFDEASMAYVPQIIFAAGLAQNHFICMGDFRQLPAIVQNKSLDSLKRDIFSYTGIISAVENGYGHNWLVMLNTQRRMHPDISDFVSKNQYNDLMKSEESLIIHRQSIADLAPAKGESMCMSDLSGMYSVCIKTMDQSRINILSAMISTAIAVSYECEYDIGIITPYNAQSRLIISMLRDLQETDDKYKSITCATVHQFQGSEKPIIIFDTVDCYRMPYIGNLLTSMENKTADRLFNVALTRTQGKFILVCNADYLKRKNLSKKLMLSQEIQNLKQNDAVCKCYSILSEINSADKSFVIGDINSTWNQYIADIKKAKKAISIDIPGIMAESDGQYTEISRIFKELDGKGVKIRIRIDENVFPPEQLEKYTVIGRYIANPITVIDDTTVWFGQPLCTADFVSEGKQIETQYYAAVRFKGTNFTRAIKAFLEL